MTIEHPKRAADQNPLQFVNDLFESVASVTAGMPAPFSVLVFLPLCLIITVVVIAYVFLLLPIHLALKGLSRLFLKSSSTRM